MKVTARWDGTSLTITQRPSAFLWLGLLATLVLVPGGARFIATSSVGVTDVIVLIGIGVVAVTMPALAVTRWQTLTLDARRGLERRGWQTHPTIGAGKIRKVLLRREDRVQTTRYGTGAQPFAVLSVHTHDGHTHEVLATDASGLSDASWKALRDALAAMPFGDDRTSR